MVVYSVLWNWFSIYRALFLLEDITMTKVNRIITVAAIVLTLLTALMCASCAKPAALTDWAYIEDAGRLVVGLDDTFAPMGFRDEGGNLVGFDIDMANAAGELLGLEIVFQPVDWDAKEFELSEKKIDCIWNGLSITPARLKELNMSDAYLNNQIAIMTVDGVEITALDQLVGCSIGTQASSAALEVMQASDVYELIKDNVNEYPTYDDVIMDMQAGRIDVMVVDLVLGEYKNSKLSAPFSVSDISFGDDLYAVGMRKGDDELTAKINDAFKQLIANGTAAEISEKWFGRNIVIGN